MWRSALRTFAGVRALAVLAILVWVVTGPIFHFSDTWQLVIKTNTTVVTFLMVFLIQNTQNRDTEAIQVKLDELIRATKGAHSALLDPEDLEEEALDAFRTKYKSQSASPTLNARWRLKAQFLRSGSQLSVALSHSAEV